MAFSLSQYSPTTLESARKHLAEGRLVEAEALGREALRRKPDSVEAIRLHGEILCEFGQHRLALAFLLRVADQFHTDPALHRQMAKCYLGMGYLQPARRHITEALHLQPRSGSAHNLAGGLALVQGDAEAAISAFRHALELKPQDWTAQSNLLHALHYTDVADREELLAEARHWETRHAPPQTYAPHANNADPDRRLTVGYVSGDLRQHPVGYLLQAAFEHRDRERFRFVCYSANPSGDELTNWFRSQSDAWRAVAGMSDTELALQIRSDQVDVLVDLSGHTSGSRLSVFAHHPAPVQASWLGYFDTTGMTSMDYIIGNSDLMPDMDDRYYTETIVRLGGAYACYTPQTDLPVAPTPARAVGYVTFGCFNRIAKVTPAVVALWARVLAAVPGSRLSLKDKAFADQAVRDRFIGMFGAHGVSVERLLFPPASPLAQYFADYSTIDIALDPFPFNGGMTTVEALWMGVPVVTLAGERYAGRMGVAHLSAAGLEELIATSTDEYVHIAVDLAGDIEGLSQLRAGMRERILASPLCDGARFTRTLEEAFRQMWRNWCSRVDMVTLET